MSFERWRKSQTPKFDGEWRHSKKLRFMGANLVPGQSAHVSEEQCLEGILSLQTKHPRLSAWVSLNSLQEALCKSWWKVMDLLLQWLNRRGDRWTASEFENPPKNPIHRREWENDRDSRTACVLISEEHFAHAREKWLRVPRFPGKKEFWLMETKSMEYGETSVHPWIMEEDDRVENAHDLLEYMWTRDDESRQSEGARCLVELFASSERLWLSAAMLSFVTPKFHRAVQSVVHWRRETPADKPASFGRTTYSCHFEFLPHSALSDLIYHTGYSESSCALCRAHPAGSSFKESFPTSEDALHHEVLLKASNIRRQKWRGLFFAASRLLQLRRRNQFLSPNGGKWVVAAGERYASLKPKNLK